MTEKKITYKDAGVDIEAGSRVIKNIKDDIKSTFSNNVLAEIGSFGGLFQVPSMNEPVLVSSVDGVGTKLMVARMAGKHDTVGQDLVNHCVNDILVQGSKPLFFLDYLGIGKLKDEVFKEILSGFIKACKENGCALIGGETAEMPGIYSDEDYDLVGTIVGIVEKDKIITGKDIKAGDKIIGLPSTGLHTNGYSLARKIMFEVLGHQTDTYLDELGETVGEALLKVHRSYLKPIENVMKEVNIHGMAHLTGGGFIDNIPRILPENVGVEIFKGSWDVLPIFDYLVKAVDLDEFEAHRTFNMGIGLVVIVAEEDYEKTMKILAEESPRLVGEVIEGEKKVTLK